MEKASLKKKLKLGDYFKKVDLSSKDLESYKVDPSSTNLKSYKIDPSSTDLKSYKVDPSSTDLEAYYNKTVLHPLLHSGTIVKALLTKHNRVIYGDKGIGKSFTYLLYSYLS